MFRKTFIRLILVLTIATTTLIVFAASKSVMVENDRECNEAEKPSKPRTELMILESFGRAVVEASGY